MEPSDWIALPALGASVIISIAGFWFNYRTNKENIRARRTEIITEKSVEAYQEVVEKLHKLRAASRLIVWTAYTEEDYTSVSYAAEDCYATFIKHRLYFPRTISENVSLVINELREVLDLSLLDRKEKHLEDANERLLKLIDRMQSYLGLEVEEAPVEKKPPKR